MRGEVNGVSLFFDTEGSKLVQRGKVPDEPGAPPDCLARG
jgi:hypothetical protein